MRPLTFSVPFLPPSLNIYRNEHWRSQREEEKTWKDFIAVKWAELGRPKLDAVRITMVFSFPDRKIRDLDNYLATGSKLVGDAVKGRFIPDDSPEHLTAWSFRFEFGDEAKTTVVIKDAGRSTAGDQATFWEDLPTRLRTAAGVGDDVGRSAEGPSSESRPACALYETCLAPLCPLDKSSLSGIWYPDEEICRSRSHGNLSWIKSQRKIARAATTGYFTLEILNSIRTIRKGITGLDPNVDEKPQLRRWLDLHERKRSDFGTRQNTTLRPERPNRTVLPSGVRRAPKPGFRLLSKTWRNRGVKAKDYAETGGLSTPTGSGRVNLRLGGLRSQKP